MNKKILTTENVYDGKLELEEQCPVTTERLGLLKPVFYNGKLIQEFSLENVRETLANNK